MTARTLLKAGVAMPLIYLAMLAAAILLSPGFRLGAEPASALGASGAAHPLIYNGGLIVTAQAGILAAIGLAIGMPALRRDWVLAVLGGLTALSLLAASIGLGFSGVFPLPDPRHYGYGLTAAAALTPLFGALALWRAGEARRSALVLGALFVGIVALVVLHVGAFPAGVTMLVAIGVLSFIVSERLAEADAGD